MEKKNVYRFFIKVDGEGLSVDEALMDAFRKIGIDNAKGLSGDIDWKLLKAIKPEEIIYVVDQKGEA